MQRRHILAYAALCLIWGSSWLAIRVTVELVPPLRAVAIRFALAAAVLALVAALKRLPMPRRREMPALLILSLGMIAVPYGLIFWAEKRVPSSTAALLFALEPLAVALLSPWMGQHRVPRGAVYAMLMAVGGILVIFTGALSATAGALLGGVGVLAAVAVSAWATLFAKRELSGVHPVVSTAFQCAAGALALIAAALLLERGQHSHWTRMALAAISFQVLFASAIAFALYYWLLDRIEPYQIATIQLVIPVVAIAEGALIGKERVPLAIVGAAALILTSVAAVLRSREDDDAALSIAARKERA